MMEWWDNMIADLAQPCQYQCHEEEPSRNNALLMYLEPVICQSPERKKPQPHNQHHRMNYLSESPSGDSIEVEYDGDSTEGGESSSSSYSDGDSMTEGGESSSWSCSDGDSMDFSRPPLGWTEHRTTMGNLLDDSISIQPSPQKDSWNRTNRTINHPPSTATTEEDATEIPLLAITSDMDDDEAKSIVSEELDGSYDRSSSILFEDEECTSSSFLSRSPPILSHSQMMDIQARGLPARMRMKTWYRIYSLNRDGSHFETMIHRTKGWKESLVVIQTDRGDILGGYVDSSWVQQKNIGFFLSKSWKFYGGGESFVFCQHPNPDKHITTIANNALCIYPWSTKNDFIQACDVRTGRMGMGGGYEFAWIVQDNFSIGMTGPSATFDSPPLVQDIDGRFNIIDFEVYGFRTSNTTCTNKCF